MRLLQRDYCISHVFSKICFHTDPMTPWSSHQWMACREVPDCTTTPRKSAGCASDNRPMSWYCLLWAAGTRSPCIGFWIACCRIGIVLYLAKQKHFVWQKILFELTRSPSHRVARWEKDVGPNMFFPCIHAVSTAAEGWGCFIKDIKG